MLLPYSLLSLRPHALISGDAAVGLDMASTEYVHWNGRGGVPASYSLGGGGVVTDVTVIGGRAGIRTAASQVWTAGTKDGKIGVR